MSREQALEQALRNIIAATHSHVDGRDLLAELHPRKQLDIKRRIDARETWFEADWLSTLWGAVKDARKALGTHSVPASEIERLRAEQAAGVMPQIGPLLDAWDGMHNDTKALLQEDAPDLARVLVAISRAMDGTHGMAMHQGATQ